MKNLDKSIKIKLNTILELHEKMRNCYFWSPRGNAASRRREEEQKSNYLEFMLGEDYYEIDQTTRCSCKNYYYKLDVQVNGVKKDVRALKKLIKYLDSIPAMV